MNENKSVLSPDELSLACLLYYDGPRKLDDFYQIGYCDSESGRRLMDCVLASLIEKKAVILERGIYRSNWAA